MAKFTVIGETKELDVDGNIEKVSSKEKFSGKMAGICYQKDTYFGTSVSDPNLAQKRFYRVISTGHHSITGHVNITVLCENISKMLAMVLNSTNHYNTSEKSGRYTLMTGNSKEEQDLYNKWKTIFHSRILEVEPSYDDDILNKNFEKEFRRLDNNSEVPKIVDGKLKGSTSEIELSIFYKLKNDTTLPSWKIAQENARYVLSIFTRSTTMAYTTDLAQWNYIYDWGKKFIEFNKNNNNYFVTELSKDLSELCDFIEKNLYIDELRDIKGRCFDFLTNLTTDDYFDISKANKFFDFNYLAKYKVSFVSLAQLQRHRTLKYYMTFNPDNITDFYIPHMIEDNNSIVNDWLNDLNSIKSYIPQATLVDVVEIGTMQNFILKCKERLCGRAQYETMVNTVHSVDEFVASKEKHLMSDLGEFYLNKLVDFKTNGYNIKTKCMLIGGCKEPCYFTRNRALTRKL